MASITIRNLDEPLKSRLRIQAAVHGRSLEEEARDILRAALEKAAPCLTPLAGMSLNIKIPRTRQLAAEIAKRMGVSLTTAVTTAVQERLERLRREQGRRLSDRLLEIGRDCAKRLKEPRRSVGPGDLLHDERGFPSNQ